MEQSDDDDEEGPVELLVSDDDVRVRRGRRRRGTPRKRTIATKRITREDLRVGAIMYPPVDVERPRTRGDCLPGGCNEERPCPWVACKHHLYLDVNPETGSITLNFPWLEPWDMSASCAIDEAENGGLTLEEVGERMNLTRERARQIEVRGLVSIKRDHAAELGADLPDAPLSFPVTERSN